MSASQAMTYRLFDFMTAMKNLWSIRFDLVCYSNYEQLKWCLKPYVIKLENIGFLCLNSINVKLLIIDFKMLSSNSSMKL